MEEKVFVPLLSAQGRQAQDTFEEKIAYVLEDNFVTANYPPDEAGQHGTSDCPVLFMAPVKGGPRMAVKVGAYRKEAELDALVNLIFQRHRGNSGNHKEKLKGLEGMRKVTVSLGFSDYENMKLEPLAKRCAEKMELEPPPSSNWPHVQQLGDCLRCTIECPDVHTMLRCWRRLRKTFHIRKGHGRLKNILFNTKIPPCMLVS